VSLVEAERKLPQAPYQCSLQSQPACGKKLPCFKVTTKYYLLR